MQGLDNLTQLRLALNTFLYAEMTLGELLKLLILGLPEPCITLRTTTEALKLLNK